MQTDVKISCQLKYLDDSVLLKHQTAICSSLIVLAPYITNIKQQAIMQQQTRTTYLQCIPSI